ncbi:MAG: class II fumarate hydratase [Proteobacteria bacterium]|nr:class II fumarate hydratase [Pseudomonadota bacterium]MBU1640474.1 class II fumarate hydratase [Pseudomonadota bacterium]
MMDFRLEKDSMGEVPVPQGALYGAQTQRAVDNFAIGNVVMPAALIKALAIIKKAAAETNMDLGLLNSVQGEAIAAAAQEIIDGNHAESFPVSVFQTGSGTSSNMNINEVIVGLATRQGVVLSANDHVNLGQSSNDVIPTALHLAVAMGVKGLVIPALSHLAKTIRRRALEYGHVIKTGRTHLMDALPIRLGAELEAWAAALDECLERFSSVMPRLQRLPLGGTAVGSGVNCHPDFSARAIKRINGMTALECTVASNFYKGLSSLDTVVETSGQLRTAAVVLIKICNDLRWMNSGPGAGLAEIALPALQPGSSIMPAKVNPVIPEAVLMACAQIMGNDHVVSLAGQGGSFQLNTMLPVAAHNILQAIDLLSGSARDLADKAVAGFTVNEEMCGRFVSRNPILVTALNAKIGYLAAAEIAKKAMAEDRSILEVALEETDLSQAELEALLDPARLADGG